MASTEHILICPSSFPRSTNSFTVLVNDLRTCIALCLTVMSITSHRAEDRASIICETVDVLLGDIWSIRHNIELMDEVLDIIINRHINRIFCHLGKIKKVLNTIGVVEFTREASLKRFSSFLNIATGLFCAAF